MQYQSQTHIINEQKIPYTKVIRRTINAGLFMHNQSIPPLSSLDIFSGHYYKYTPNPYPFSPSQVMTINILLVRRTSSVAVATERLP